MNDKAFFEIGVMVQELIDFWKNSEEEYAKYYVDAYECIKHNVSSILKNNSLPRTVNKGD